MTGGVIASRLVLEVTNGAGAVASPFQKGFTPTTSCREYGGLLEIWCKNVGVGGGVGV